jgi:hypothetical protein
MASTSHLPRRGQEARTVVQHESIRQTRGAYSNTPTIHAATTALIDAIPRLVPTRRQLKTAARRPRLILL